MRNPFFGSFFSFGEEIGGGHSQILDYLARSGLFGTIIIILLIQRIRRWSTFKLIEKDGFRKLQIALAIVIASINTFISPEIYFAILVMPLLFQASDNTKKNSLGAEQSGQAIVS